MVARSIWHLLRTTFDEWLEDRAPRLAAALAYYTVFSLAPVLVIAIAVAGLFLEGAEQYTVNQITSIVGPEAGDAVRSILSQQTSTSTDLKATAIGLVTLLIGATGLFGQLQDALNTIWEVRPRPDRGFADTLKRRFFSFTMVLGVGFLLLVSFVLSAVLTAVIGLLGGHAEEQAMVWKAVEVVFSLAMASGLFALIFKLVPDATVAWRDVWVGAVTTSLLFALGKELIARFLATETAASAYGAAGALVLLLIWVYYSAQILFLGAELTQVYARLYGSGIQPLPDAEPVPESRRAQEGMPHTTRA